MVKLGYNEYMGVEEDDRYYGIGREIMFGKECIKWEPQKF